MIKIIINRSKKPVTVQSNWLLLSPEDCKDLNKLTILVESGILSKLNIAVVPKFINKELKQTIALISKNYKVPLKYEAL